MQSKILSRRTILMVFFAGFVLFAVLLFDFFSQTEVKPMVDGSTIVKHEKIIFGLPIRLKIPLINVDAAFEYVGLTPDGAMDVPKSPENVAWFNLGPRPGDFGSSVVAGHFGWKNSLPAVFDNLHKLQIGDKLSIEDEKGKVYIFVVRELRTYGSNDVVPEVFGSTDGKSHLNLITCQGVWNKSKQSYPKRLVVFTDKE